MRYTKDAMLLLPPKCGSRYCEDYIIAERVTGESCGVGDDWTRHMPLRYLSDHVKSGRSLFVMSRDPYSWYESFWRHMSVQDFAYNAYWGHIGAATMANGKLQFPRKVPDFKASLRDYLFGHNSPKNRRMSAKIADHDRSIIWADDHLLNQHKMGCGLWSYWMRYFSCDGDDWNTESRFIFLDEQIDDAIQVAGFTLAPNRKPLGARPEAERAPVRWDQEMVSWVKEADGPTMKLVESQKVEV